MNGNTKDQELNISIYFMLKLMENKFYIIPVDRKGNKIENYDEIDGFFDENTHLVLDELKNFKKDSFFIDWGENNNEDFCLNEYTGILDFLEQSDKFVDENFNKIIFKEDDNTLSLLISEIENDDNYLNSDIILGDQFKNPYFLDDNIAIVDNKIFYLNMEKDEFHSFDELICKIDKNRLEIFITLILKYFPQLSFDYLDYSITNDVPSKPELYMIIEKIAQDKSLYLKIELSISTMDYEFFKENKISKIAIVNDMEKKINISDINLDEINVLTDEITKVLIKRQKDLKVRSGFFVDDSNLIIMQEKLAKEFIMNDLLQFASVYKIEGTDRLKKYNIRPVKPRIVGGIGESIDYLDGANLELEIEGEKFSILDVLSSYRNGTSYVSLSDGTNALINKKYIEKLERLFKSEDKVLKLSFFDYPLIESMLESKIAESHMKKNKDFFIGINKLNEYNVPLPKINADLREYQVYGYKWLHYLLANNLGGCLADDMGLGKTLQAIAILTKLYETSSGHSLVVMPKSLIYNWENEINRFSSGLTIGIYYGNNRSIDIIGENNVTLTTYGTIRNDIEKLKELNFDLLILDESQNIKNVNAQTTKAILLLNAENRIALSGTPIENNLSELYSLFRFLNPAMFGSYTEFNTFYAEPIQKFNDKDAINELKKKIYPFILRRVKKEVLKDLPDKIEKTMFIEMNSPQKRLYDERRAYYYHQVKNQIQENGLGKSHFFILQALNELRQIASCPENKSVNVISSKREVLIHNVVEAVENGHKVLVFTNYITSIKNICDDLENIGIKYISMSGGTKDRQSLVNKFQLDKKCKVFVMTLKTGGVGLNLTAADTIFIYDPWWNKTVENQAIDRAYRLGQDRTVFAYKLILKDTIEEKILKLQEKKSELLDSLISEDNTSMKFLTENDIEFILGD
ncbi:MAG: DEAD/DEAH box helicase [Fusobacteriaceae bacterium]|jgi:SNF2 family DNA or RNA helicase|nr:DEAD/DEAH box helicase [Fusobacteriaceae bacterium]